MEHRTWQAWQHTAGLLEQAATVAAAAAALLTRRKLQAAPTQQNVICT